MNYYFVLEGYSLRLLPSWITCKEDAWNEAPNELENGQFLMEVPRRFAHLVRDAEKKGPRLYDVTGYHFIGSVVAYKEKDRVSYLEPLNPDT